MYVQARLRGKVFQAVPGTHFLSCILIQTSMKFQTTVVILVVPFFSVCTGVFHAANHAAGFLKIATQMIATPPLMICGSRWGDLGLEPVAADGAI
jgi:hypothetical protein